jgi:hypothetical protein
MTDPVMLLSQVHGEGRVTFRALRAAGFVTLASVAEAPVQMLSDRAHLSGQTARRLKSGAEQMISSGIGRTVAPPAKARARGAARPGKSNGGHSATPVSFSEGVTLEEAGLLGQGVPARSAAPEPESHAIRPLAAPAPLVRPVRRGGFWTFG